MRRCRGEEGLTSTQLAVVMPAVIFLIMLIVQYGLWAHAKQVASAAAGEGVHAGRVPGAAPTAAEQAARSFLAGAGNLDDIAVTVASGADSVTVRVDGQAPRLVPGISWKVAAVAEAPLEQFVPENERGR